MKHSFAVGIALVLCGLASGAAVPAPTTPKATTAGKAVSAKQITTKSGLKYVDLVVGKGPTPQVGQTVSVLYVGKLTNGTTFDSTGSGKPFETPIGVGQVIKGWDEGMLTMHVGGKRRLTIPPSLGYGAQAQGPIPANSTLVFDITLLAIK